MGCTLTLSFIRDVLCEDYVSFGAKGLIKGVFHLKSCTLSLATSLLETVKSFSFGIIFGAVTLVLISERAKNHRVSNLANKGHVPVQQLVSFSYTAWHRLLSELKLRHDVWTLCWAEVQTVYYAQLHITLSKFLQSKPCRLHGLVWTNKILYLG